LAARVAAAAWAAAGATAAAAIVVAATVVAGRALRTQRHGRASRRSTARRRRRPRRSRPRASRRRATSKRGGRPRGPIPSAKLEIEQQADSVTLKSPSHRRTFLVDAQTHDQEGALTNVTARFKSGALEVESKGERGTRIEKYSVKDGRLVIEFENQGSGQRPGFKFHLVYDREAAS
jgi:hypothetical protein